jgi:hypothetical protein
MHVRLSTLAPAPFPDDPTALLLLAVLPLRGLAPSEHENEMEKQEPKSKNLRGKRSVKIFDHKVAVTYPFARDPKRS